MKLSHILETSYAKTNTPVWLQDVETIARTYKSKPEFHQELLQWARENVRILNHLWDAIIDDRNQFLDQYEPDEEDDHDGHTELNPQQRLVAAELWASSVSHQDYPIYNELYKRHDPDFMDTIGNIMMDSAGGLRDET